MEVSYFSPSSQSFCLELPSCRALSVVIVFQQRNVHVFLCFIFCFFLFVRRAAQPAGLEGSGEPLMIYIYKAKLRRNDCYLRDLCWQFEWLRVLWWFSGWLPDNGALGNPFTPPLWPLQTSHSCQIQERRALFVSNQIVSWFFNVGSIFTLESTDLEMVPNW